MIVFADLARELLLEVVGHLDCIEDVVVLRGVCRSWRFLIENVLASILKGLLLRSGSPVVLSGGAVAFLSRRCDGEFVSREWTGRSG